MANFCKYCGRALQDGEICSCPQAQTEAAQKYQGQQPQQQPPQQTYQQPPQGYQPPPQGYQPPPQGYQPPPQGYQAPQFQQAPAGPNPVTTAASNVAPYFKSYFKSPLAAARDLIAKKNLGLALMLLLIQAVAGGLVLLSVQSSFCSTLEDLIEDSYGGSYIYYYSRSEVSVDPDIAMALLFGILAAVAAIAIFAVIAFAIAKIMGSPCAFKDVVIACGANSIIVTLLLLLSFIFFFIVWILGCILLVAAMVAWMVLAVPTIQAVTPNSDQGKFWICTVVGILATLLIGGWASAKLASTSFNPVSITVDDETQTVDDILELVDRQLRMMDFDDMDDIYEVGIVAIILYWNW